MMAATAAAPAARADSFTIGRPAGGMSALMAGTLQLPVHCPQACWVQAEIATSNDNARKLALPEWHDDQTVGSQTADDTAPAGDSQLPLGVTDDAAEYLRPSLAFPLFAALPVTITASATWTEPDGSLGQGEATTAGSLDWPDVPRDRHGAGSAGLVRSITATTSYALGARRADFRVSLARLTGTRTVRAYIHTAGGLLRTKAFRLDGSRLRIPLRGPGLPAQIAAAKSVAPIAAEVVVQVLRKPGGAVLDTGRLRFLMLT